jgi:curved DNA-binding protein
MYQESFVDYYEILQVSPNADSETIERVFRLLAKRYHTDNQRTGDAGKFTMLSEAYEVLSQPEKRAAYDVKYEEGRALQWKIFDEASPSEGVDTDRRIQQGILSILYITRRRDALRPGVGVIELERLLGVPQRHLDFHFWYLKEKGWIQRTDNGQFAITVSGVDAVAENNLLLRKDRLLPIDAEFSRNAEASSDFNTDRTAFLTDHQTELSS